MDGVEEGSRVTVGVNVGDVTSAVRVAAASAV
jgi:hypothetical protein